MSKRLWSICFIIFILIGSSPLNARRKKLPNCLQSIVIFEKIIKNNSGEIKEYVTGTGFIATYQDKLVAVTNLNIIFQTLSPEIKTIDGNRLKYSNILIPADKRNIILFELDQETSSDHCKPLKLEKNVSAETDIDAKVISFGCKSNWTTVTRSKGKISGLGPINLEIKSKISYNMNGGPVLAAETGKVIAVISIISSNTGGRNRNKYTQGVRIDSVKSMLTLDKQKFSEDVDKLRAKRLIIHKMNEEYEKYHLRIEQLSDRVQGELGTTNIKKLEQEYRRVLKRVQSMAGQLKAPMDFRFPYFQKRYKHLFHVGQGALQQFRSLESLFEDIGGKRKKAKQKNKFKGVDFEL